MDSHYEELYAKTYQNEIDKIAAGKLDAVKSGLKKILASGRKKGADVVAAATTKAKDLKGTAKNVASFKDTASKTLADKIKAFKPTPNIKSSTAAGAAIGAGYGAMDKDTSVIKGLLGGAAMGAGYGLGKDKAKGIITKIKAGRKTV